MTDNNLFGVDNQVNADTAPIDEVVAALMQKISKLYAAERKEKYLFTYKQRKQTRLRRNGQAYVNAMMKARRFSWVVKEAHEYMSEHSPDIVTNCFYNDEYLPTLQILLAASIAAVLEAKRKQEYV